jgi:hypothetical protein
MLRHCSLGQPDRLRLLLELVEVALVTAMAGDAEMIVLGFRCSKMKLKQKKAVVLDT